MDTFQNPRSARSVTLRHDATQQGSISGDIGTVANALDELNWNIRPILEKASQIWPYHGNISPSLNGRHAKPEPFITRLARLHCR